MNQKKILFIDRDGTLIEEPEDCQIDHIEKLALIPDVIPALLTLKNAGFTFVMVSNQDGLGTDSFPLANFNLPHDLLLRIFDSQGITFEAVRICPHLPSDGCDCRKPKVGLVLDYLVNQTIQREYSYVIGDRETDLQFANNLGVKGIRLGETITPTWNEVTRHILSQSRSATIIRKTKETEISIHLDLDDPDNVNIDTGIGFFDHMLEQLAKHGGFGMALIVNGDLHVDDHHTVEDSAIALGEALRKALGNKIGIGRYGFMLPMDEALSQVAIDLSGRSYFVLNAAFSREYVGDLSTELISHFFRSFAEAMKATLHIDVKGENNHHMIESMFKGVGRALRQAITKIDDCLPSTKGVL